ncbi:Putative methylsterol monooxygenase DDB [Seminavis robusta]|uniref:Methylsterol monooxygenase DDB n=1 Tax=Seminavis robusta TaxID=568900 RepID=A0A9N8EXY7_9STRA|nr:Putative methylsterol monooxygenase DDB [Seminavis robusta]|eukprot:Sro2218_g319510.1 Putative methylsterol monooxygenase DDB (345) ;mRNA; f:1783-2914
MCCAATSTTESALPPSGSGINIQPTFWKTEKHRYEPSFWLIARVAVLYSFFQIVEKLGVFVWPKILEYTVTHGFDVRSIALPTLATMGIGVFFLYSFGFYGFIYVFLDKTPFFQRYRVHKGDWPWKVDPKRWNALLWTTTIQVVFNFALYIPQMLMIKFVLGTPCPWRVDVETLPSAGEMFWQTVFFLFMEDLIVYHTHKVMHSKRFYWMHKRHHSFKHCFGVCTAYSHPFDDLVESAGPAIVGPLILWDRMHVWTLFVWLVVGINCTTETHSGYELPWSMYQLIPFMCTTDFHEFHHRFPTKGNYSSTLMFWDEVHGTNKEYYAWVQAGRPFPSDKEEKTKDE